MNIFRLVTIAGLAGFSWVLYASAPVWAQEASAEANASVETSRDSKEYGMESRVETSAKARFMAGRFGVRDEFVVKLREEGMGWGEITHLLALSERSGRTMSEILALRKGGLGWGAIARKYDLNLGEVQRDVRRVDENFNQIEKTHRQELRSHASERRERQAERIERVQPRIEERVEKRRQK